jgi:hypothetical protein
MITIERDDGQIQHMIYGGSQHLEMVKGKSRLSGICLLGNASSENFSPPL